MANIVFGVFSHQRLACNLTPCVATAVCLSGALPIFVVVCIGRQLEGIRVCIHLFAPTKQVSCLSCGKTVRPRCARGRLCLVGGTTGECCGPVHCLHWPLCTRPVATLEVCAHCIRAARAPKWPIGPVLRR